jgi:hypothetical protein
MEKQIKIIRIFILVFGLVFFSIGAGIGYSFYTTNNTPNAGHIDYILPIVFMSIGLLDVLIIIIWALVSKNKVKKQKWLLENGQSIRTKFISADINTHITVNNRSPYVIVCHWRDPITQNIYVFRSNNIWYNPTEFIDKAKTINVFYDPANMKSYLMDVSFLPIKG